MVQDFFFVPWNLLKGNIWECWQNWWKDVLFLVAVILEGSKIKGGGALETIESADV